jgi:hypothetical protein
MVIAFGEPVSILARNSHAYAAMLFTVARLGPAAPHARIYLP